MNNQLHIPRLSSPVRYFPFSGASDAESTSILVNPEVVPGIGMPFWTMSFVPIVISFPYLVFSFGDKFQMIRINTSCDSAQMIHDISIREDIEPVMESVREAMREDGSFVAEYASVAFGERPISIGFNCVPYPAGVIESFGNITQMPTTVEPVLYRFPPDQSARSGIFAVHFSANPAGYGSISVDQSISICVFMTPFAMSPSLWDMTSFVRIGRSSPAVLDHGHHFQVQRIHAENIEAQMIDGKAVFDWLDVDFIRDAMSVTHYPFDAHLSPISRGPTNPIPTRNSIDSLDIGALPHHPFGIESGDVLFRHNLDIDDELPQYAIMSSPSLNHTLSVCQLSQSPQEVQYM